jgi:hypothetical protein
MIVKNEDSLKYLFDYKDGKISKGLGIGCKLDEHIVFKYGQFVPVLGGDNVGKTYFMTWYMLCLSVRHGLKWGLWMDENSAGQVTRDLIQWYSGVKFEHLSKTQIEDYANTVWQWFTFVDNKQPYTPTELLGVFEKIDANGYFIDPFNQLNHDMNYESNIKFIRMLKRWCKNNRKTVYLSMHPVSATGRKSYEYPDAHMWAGQPCIPNKSMAEGGKLFANMADDWINCHRLTKLESMKYFTMIDIDKVKDRDTGGSVTMQDEPILLHYNNGLGFVIEGINPLRKEENKPISNLNFWNTNNEVPF